MTEPLIIAALCLALAFALVFALGLWARAAFERDTHKYAAELLHEDLAEQIKTNRSQALRIACLEAGNQRLARELVRARGIPEVTG